MCDKVAFYLWEFKTSIWYRFPRQKILFTKYVNNDSQVPVCEIQVIQEFCDENEHDSSNLDFDFNTGHYQIGDVAETNLKIFV